MSTESRTLAAQIDPDSELANQFDEYREQISAQSNSEAVRQLVRVGLEQEHEPARGDGSNASKGGEDPDTQPNSQPLTTDIIKGNEPILAGLAFLLGGDGFLAAATSVAGEAAGTMIYATTGLLILLSLAPIFVKRIRDMTGAATGKSGRGSQS